MKTERHYMKSSYAEWWTSRIRKYPPGHYRTIIEFLNVLAPKEKDVVLEIGTGEGRFIPLLLRPKVCYIGVDVCVRMLKYAKDYLTSKNKEQVHFVVAEATHLPFRSKSVSKSFSYATMFFIPNKKEAISEMERVSKGRILVELRNILSPRIALAFIKRRLISLLALRIMKGKILQRPYFPDTPLQLFRYFDGPFNIYSFSQFKLKKYDRDAKKWWFKSAIIVETLMRVQKTP